MPPGFVANHRGRRHGTRLAIRLVTAAVLGALVPAGCAHLHIPGQGDQAYSSLSERVPTPDMERLRGRMIVLDPGHGLGFDGAVGPGGLTEAEVNLDVAIRLAGLLREYGATVVLTRALERSPGSSEEPDLREDLRARVNLAGFLRADLFLSIHHNSSLDRGNEYDETETYYRMGDEGPSLDAGRAIHAHLAANLGIPAGGLIPGNYFVLRESRAPAVLGEASYISNRRMEKKLRTGEARLLEARAYLLGILDYFDGGRPVIRPLGIPRDTVRTAMPSLSLLVEPGLDGIPVDPASISLMIDGLRIDPLALRFSGDTLRYHVPAPLASGPHRFEVGVRNVAGNAALPFRWSPRVVVPAAEIDLRVRPGGVLPRDPRGLFLVEVVVRDGSGAPVADGREVRLRLGGVAAGTRTGRTTGGRVGFLLRTPNGPRLELTASCDEIEVRRVLEVGPPEGAMVLCLLRDGRSDEPIGGVTVELSDGQTTHPAVTSSEGFAAILLTEGGRYRLRTRRRGYHGYEELIELRRGGVTRLELGLNPVQGGILAGRRVLIDPEQRREADGMIGTSRRSDLNLRAAGYLRDLLEAAGSLVETVRTQDVPLSPTARIVRSVESGAEVHIVLKHARGGGGNSLLVSHYPGSVAGERLAGLIREEASRLAGWPARVGETASTVMRHTPSPAVTVETRIGRGGESADRALRVEAYAIYNALLRYGGVLEAERHELLCTVEDKDGQPVVDAVVRVDDALSLRTGPDGRVRLGLLDAGTIRLRVVAAGFESAGREVSVGVGGERAVRLVLERQRAGGAPGD